jgi:hypothetical protein
LPESASGFPYRVTADRYDGRLFHMLLERLVVCLNANALNERKAVSGVIPIHCQFPP